MKLDWSDYALAAVIFYGAAAVTASIIMTIGSATKEHSLLVEKCVDHEVVIYGPSFGRARVIDSTNKPKRCQR